MAGKVWLEMADLLLWEDRNPTDPIEYCLEVSIGHSKKLILNVPKAEELGDALTTWANEMRMGGHYKAKKGGRDA